MIKTKEDLKRYLAADAKALNFNRKKPKLFGDKIWKYQILYRKAEYYFNNKKRHPLLYVLYLVRFKKKSEKWGNELPFNCIDEGLRIWHGQNIILNGNVKAGKNLQISTGVIIGQAHNESPVIGDNVNLSVDCKVLGGITIADNVVVGAGAVVVKSVDVPYATVAGVPARIIAVHNPN